MLLHLRPYQPDDLPVALALWNKTFLLDATDEEHFAAVINDTRNTTRVMNTLAMADDRYVGFASVAIAQHSPNAAYLRAIAAEPDLLERVVPLLLNHFQTRLKLQRVALLDLCRFSAGAHFFPGLDPFYASLKTALHNVGFAEVERIYDARVNLDDYALNDYQIRTARQVAATGIKVSQFTPDQSDAMSAFIEKSNLEAWFAPGWQQQLAASKAIVIRHEDAIIGYAQYRWNGDGVSFGPVAVLPNKRGRGIGTALLAMLMNRMKQSGVRSMSAKWALPLSYYQKNGWQIAREYVALVKNL